MPRYSIKPVWMGTDAAEAVGTVANTCSFKVELLPGISFLVWNVLTLSVNVFVAAESICFYQL